MSEDIWKIKTLASETSKGVIWCCKVLPPGITAGNPQKPVNLSPLYRMPHPKSFSLRLCVAASAKQGGGEGLENLIFKS